MKKIIFTAAVLCSALTWAKPYTDGWLRDAPDDSWTNYPSFTGNYGVKSASVITNRQARKSLKAAPRLLASGSGQSLDGLERLLPAASDARIRELARGLEYDWEKCFNFVRDNIAFSLYPGIMKGPERTLMDKEGNDADQSFLLVALLRASGYSGATVIYEPAQIDSLIRSGFAIPIFNFNGESPYNVADWLGIKCSGSAKAIRDKVLWRISRIFGSNYATLNTTSVVIPHYWVALPIDGVTRYLDPSLKPCVKTWCRDVLSDAGYDRSALISAAGGSVVSGLGVRNLSKVGVSNELVRLCTNLRNVWTNANEAAGYFVGSSKIVPRGKDDFFHGEYFSETQIDLSTQTAEYVNALRTKTIVTCDDVDFVSFYLDELGLRNLWLTSVLNGSSSATSKMYLDDDCIKSLNTSSGSYSAKVVVDVQHSHSTTHPYYLARGTDKVYSLVVGFGGDAKNGIRKYASEELSRIKATGLADSDVRMMAASLYLQGQQWLSQCTMCLGLMNNVTDDSHQYYYNIGIAGQSDAPYVDMANCFMHSSNSGSLFSQDSFFSSALEHSVVEQLNDVAAVSTVKILNLANQNGNTVYFVTSQNVASVVSQISNYSSSFKSTLQSEATEGATYLLPQNGLTVLNQWGGTGYVRHMAEEDGRISTTMAISGGMNGGFGTENTKPKVNQVYEKTTPSHSSDEGITFMGYADPVSVPYGSYDESETDMALNRHVPLIWGRSYSSANSIDKGMGVGWTYNYDTSIGISSDPDAIFARKDALSAIPSALAMAIANDLLLEQTTLQPEENARRWLLAAMVVQWWTERLKDGAVTVNFENESTVFQKLFDGTFVPPMGVTMSLSISNGCYNAKYRHGNLLKFNASKKLSEIVDLSGNSIRLEYNGISNSLSRIENDYGGYFLLNWGDGRHITSVADNTGRSVHYTYNLANCLVQVVDTMNQLWTYGYDGATKQMLRKTDPLGNRYFENAYNVFGQVTNQTSITGGNWSFGYADGLSSWNINPLGFISRQGFDFEGRPIWTENRYGVMSWAKYNTAGKIIEREKTDGSVMRYTYDGRGDLVATEEIGGGTNRINRFGYDADHRLIAMTNMLGQGSVLAYDSAGRMIISRDPSGAEAQNEWNSNGSLRCKTQFDKDGHVVTKVSFTYNGYGLPEEKVVTGASLPNDGIRVRYSYSPMGLLEKMTNSDGAEWRYVNDNRGHVLETHDPAHGVTMGEYDAAGRLVATTDRMNRRTTLKLSPSGGILSCSFPDGSTISNSYDALDNIIFTTDVRGMNTWYEYDAMGSIVSISNLLGKTSITRDMVGRTVATKDLDGNITKYSYDMFGRMTAVERANGAVWRYSYDIIDRAVKTTDPVGRSIRNGHDVMGNVIQVVKNSGINEDFKYDFYGKLEHFNNAESCRMSFLRDGLGRLLAITNAIGIQMYSAEYDKSGNCIKETDGDGRVKTSQYNALGWLVSQTLDEQTTVFAYDGDGNVTNIAKGVDERVSLAYNNRGAITNTYLKSRGIEWSTSYVRDIGSLVTAISYGEGCVLHREYDNAGRLIRILDWLGNRWEFSYDASGRMVKRVSPDGIEDDFSYDTLGLVKSWNIGSIIGRSITRNAAGVRTSEEIVNGGVPRMADAAVRSTRYDSADRIIQIEMSDGQGSHTDTYSYDQHGATVGINRDGVNAARFEYGADGRLVGINDIDSYEIIYGYDSLNCRIWYSDRCFVPDYCDGRRRPMVELDESGNVVRRFIWVGDSLVGIIEGTRLLCSHTDVSGNVVVLADSTGDVVFKANYGPNGEDFGHTGENHTPFWWQGGVGAMKIAVSTLGDCYLLGERLYSAMLHRFLQPDPLAIDGGGNLYAYANSNPIAHNDPSGLCWENLDVPDDATVYDRDHTPKGGKYKAGDYVWLDNGRYYRVNEDMAVDGIITRNIFTGKEVKTFRGELMKIDDGYGLADYENGNAFVNNRVVRHNVLVSAPVLKEAYDVGTAQPKHFVEHVLLVKDTVDFVNDAAELKNKILPLSTQPSSTKFLELTKRNANVQSQSNGGSKQTYKRGNFLDITKRKNGGTSSGGGSSSSGNSQSQQQSQNQTASNSEGTKNTEQMSVEALRSLEAIKETLEYFKNAEINRVLDIGGNGPCFPGGLGGALGL